MLTTGEPAREEKERGQEGGEPRPESSEALQAGKPGRGVRVRDNRAQGEGPEGEGRDTGQRDPAPAPSCPWGLQRGAGERDLSHHIPLS